MGCGASSNNSVQTVDPASIPEPATKKSSAPAPVPAPAPAPIPVVAPKSDMRIETSGPGGPSKKSENGSLSNSFSASSTCTTVPSSPVFSPTLDRKETEPIFSYLASANPPSNLSLNRPSSPEHRAVAAVASAAVSAAVANAISTVTGTPRGSATPKKLPNLA